MSPVSSKSAQVISRLKRKRDASPDSTDTSSSISEPEQTEDTPVLSHAARRKQKKKALSEESAPSRSSTKKQKNEEEVSHPAKRQNSVWVGNLSYKTTQESLRRFFAEVGEITRVHLPTKLGKASPGESARRENRGCVFPLLPSSFGSLTVLPGLQFCLCGLCDARRQESRHHDVRVSFRRSPPLNQGWCVGFFVSSCVRVRTLLNTRAQATALKVAP